MEEARIAGALEHPNILPVYDAGIDDEDRPYFCMKLVRGNNLADVLRGLRERNAGIESEWTLQHLLGVYMQVCHAMAFAHEKGVIHRDLKPANILLGQHGQVLVMDWGLAKVAGSSRASRERAAGDSPTGSATERLATIIGRHRSRAGTLDTLDGIMVGTVCYMAPEQAAGENERVDQRSDIYALGGILYEILTLQPPVPPEGSPQDIARRVIAGEVVPPQVRTPDRPIPDELAAVAMKAMAPDPHDRYQDAEELRRDIERYLDGRAVTARPDSLGQALVKLVRRNKAAAAVAAAALAVIVGRRPNASATTRARPWWPAISPSASASSPSAPRLRPGPSADAPPPTTATGPPPATSP
jgi:serine/threonine protein kinase